MKIRNCWRILRSLWCLYVRPPEATPGVSSKSELKASSGGVAVHTRSAHKAPLALKSIQLGFRVMGAVSPALASRFAYRLWFKPMRFKTPASEQDARQSACIENEAVNGNRITTYRWGQIGPLVLMVHGWSGRGTQLGAYVQPLLTAGFQVMSFDLPAHGDSEGKYTTLLAVAEVVKQLAVRHGPVHSIISHSFGGPCIALALKEGMQAGRVVAISPPAETRYLFDQFCQTLRLNQKTIKHVTERFEAEFGENIWRRISMSANVTGLSIPALIVHDEDDSDVSWTEGLSVAQNWPQARFIKTRGLGHRRILKEKAIVDEVVAFIKR